MVCRLLRFLPAAGLAAGICMAGDATAQSVTLAVVDSITAAAVPAAVIAVHHQDGGRTVLTSDSAGIVVIELANVLALEVSRFGYHPKTVSPSSFTVPRDTLRMRPHPAQLRALSISAGNPYHILRPDVGNMYARRAGAKRVDVRILVRGDPLFENLM
jgi:hypothetical protein